jgi:predicted nuclease with TOPRIM domain
MAVEIKCDNPESSGRHNNETFEGAIVCMDCFKKVVEERDELKKKNDELESDKESLQQEKDDLESEHNELKAEVEKLKAEKTQQ